MSQVKILKIGQIIWLLVQFNVHFGSNFAFNANYRFFYSKGNRNVTGKNSKNRTNQFAARTI
jgi:hypothetical protein